MLGNTPEGNRGSTAPSVFSFCSVNQLGDRESSCSDGTLELPTYCSKHIFCFLFFPVALGCKKKRLCLQVQGKMLHWLSGEEGRKIPVKDL